MHQRILALIFICGLSGITLAGDKNTKVAAAHAMGKAPAPAPIANANPTLLTQFAALTLNPPKQDGLMAKFKALTVQDPDSSSDVNKFIGQFAENQKAITLFEGIRAEIPKLLELCPSTVEGAALRAKVETLKRENKKNVDETRLKLREHYQNLALLLLNKSTVPSRELGEKFLTDNEAIYSAAAPRKDLLERAHVRERAFGIGALPLDEQLLLEDDSRHHRISNAILAAKVRRN